MHRVQSLGRTVFITRGREFTVKTQHQLARLRVGGMVDIKASVQTFYAVKNQAIDWAPGRKYQDAKNLVIQQDKGITPFFHPSYFASTSRACSG